MITTRPNQAFIHNIVLLASLAFILNLYLAFAVPIGPSATIVNNSTFTVSTNALVNSTIAGGYIFTINLDAVEQNSRWKAYVGNVSGTLTLDDASSFTIFSWDLGTTSGEVYATRSASSINWSAINCTWAGTKNSTGHASPTNRTIERAEDSAMSHTRLDNITSTFSNRSHPQIQVGEKIIGANQCYSIHPYVADTLQNDNFSELILWDGNNAENGSVVYAGLIENNMPGFNDNASTNITYDFQMIIPENGASTWTSSTAYYFYVELT